MGTAFSHGVRSGLSELETEARKLGREHPMLAVFADHIQDIFEVIGTLEWLADETWRVHQSPEALAKIAALIPPASKQASLREQVQEMRARLDQIAASVGSV